MTEPSPLERVEQLIAGGRLGLWTPPAEVLAWIEHDLGATA